ncbi:fimbrial protein [Robertmurraya yapensis]|uniref:Fimbrial protein n=2 Tax=Bacillaceae TaxID=186817 RepID=A0A3S0I812_9BACI|nr:fimbrial protein [Bacillus yapensis]RTR27318.1 fimbrial protein [Bacillus yapensis]TKS94038.1 fimbrial protein [Bacillus yapensis]
MLIEINLLPQREVKNKSLLLLTIIAAAILLFGGFFAYFLNRSYENKLASLEQQISTTEQLVAAEQEKILSYEASDSLSELERTVQWAQAYPIKAVPVLQNITALLPERGFIQTFTYEETGTVQFEVQFETSREAAYYLNALLESDWVSNAKLNSLDTETEFYDKKFGETDEGPDESRLTNEKYIPRYLGQYEVKLNREFFKKNNSSATEGGDGI